MSTSDLKGSDVVRNRDFLYRVIHPCGITDDLDRCVAGICESLKDHSECHPVFRDLLRNPSEHTELAKVAIVLFALHVDPSFYAFLCKRPDACATSISMFKHTYLPHHVSKLLDGFTEMRDFVGNAKVDYICA